MWFWKRKKEVLPDVSAEPVAAVVEGPDVDAEKELADALSRYERYHYERVKGTADQSAVEARDVVRKAQKFVSEWPEPVNSSV